MLIKLRKFRSVKIVALVLAFQMFITAIDFNPVFGQSGGPTQPEVQSFEPVQTNQMVDLFTGDFTYNVPLFNIPGPDGGYPINLAYHSGIKMEQEASWVGLGWNINVGTITRQVRNLPDDFGGADDDKITIHTDMRPNWTIGVDVGIDPEVWGIGPIQFNPNVGVYYNNYRGIGYKLGLDIGMRIGPEEGISGNLGFDLSLDSQEGANADMTLGIGYSGKEYNSSLSVGTGFNSRTGWKQNLSIQAGISEAYDRLDSKGRAKNRNKRNMSTRRLGSAGGGSSISFANQMVGLGIPNQMRGANGKVSFATGFNVFSVMGKFNVSANFSVAKLKDKDKDVVYKPFGYMYYQNYNSSNYDVENDNVVKDISRENDGLIHKDTRRLGVPTQTYDVYSVTGQGIANMFRPRRDDIGTNVEPRRKSEYNGGNFGLELPLSTPVNIRAGFDVGYNYTSSKSDFWPNTNAADLGFQKSKPSMSESVYFQNYGEQTTDEYTANLGSSVSAARPVVYGLKNKSGFYDITDKDQNDNGSTIAIQNQRTSRKRRSMGFEAFTNQTILNTDQNTTVVPEYDISYYSTTGNNGYNKINLSSYDAIRSQRPMTHVGGYTAFNTSGMRYVYGLAAYNNKEKNVSFSLEETVPMLTESTVDPEISSGDIVYEQKGTDKYYQSMEKSAYAHSYMLTSVLGNDYVEFDNIAGPSDGDLGYWVKFDYARAQSNMKWRTPYEKVAYDKGYEMSFKDGKGSYSYGEKEVWYLATAETKTHIAEFIVSPRKDNFQPQNETSGGISSNSGYYKLDRIDVYVKSERYPNGQYNANAKPLKSCHFVYDYSLCTNLPGNDNSNDFGEEGVINNVGGKLTLKKCYFTYRNNGTGATTPYEFEYNSKVDNQTISYDRDAVDRWGNYQPNTNNRNVDYPYNDLEKSKAEMDKRATLWNMSAINLPSGGRYEVEYESDSYAYVQDQVAMHMTKIVSLNDFAGGVTGDIEHDKDASAENRRVYFKLEEGISISSSASEKLAEMRKYIHPGEYMYFKVKINVTKNHDSKEFVGGYGKVVGVGVDPTSASGGDYQWGYIELALMKVDNKQTHFHPFTEVGARHIKYNHPDVLYDNPGNADKEKLSKSDIKNQGKSLLTAGKDLVDIFKDFTAMLYADGTKRLRQIGLDDSYIRLRTPDKIKYGGGHRVSKVTVHDNWIDAFTPGTLETTSSYSTVYEYNMKDGDRTISSGVAAYEPMVGGDENPFRKPIEGWEDKNVTARTLAQLFSEEPGNESLFPGPTVGYRQVRVMSGNTQQKILTPDSDIESYSGVSQHEFYTSKDYPVIRSVSELETDKTFRTSKLIIPALLVNISRLRMAASQGYYIELNDMHGKPKGGSEYELNVVETSPGIVEMQEKEISNIQYDYFDEVAYQKNDAGELLSIRRLKNNVNVLYSDIDESDMTKSDISNAVLATEIEFIPETRYKESKQISASLGFNFEQFGFLPAFFPIPNFNWSQEKTGTVVTNKIVNKTGIIKRTTATQRGSKVETENLVFDQYTGQPLLTSVTNEYGDEIYVYSILARDKYEGTGPAYKNIGFESIGSTLGSLTSGVQHVSMINGSEFFEGDQLIATPVIEVVGPYSSVYVPDATRNKEVVHFSKQNVLAGIPQNDFVLETKQALNGDYRFTVIHSGRKNLLAIPVSSLTTLKNPTINRTVSNCLDRPTKGDQEITMLSLDSVLSINAVELGNHWSKDARELESTPSNWYDNAYYNKGASGVYSSVRSYGYMDDRTQRSTLNVTDVDLKNDGVMNDVKLFDWNHILAQENGCNTNWVKTDQITLKNPSSTAVETKNILGAYSSQLFGRNGTEAIAVAGNAKNTEIGFESFEEYSSGALPISHNSTNNLNFYSSIDQTTRVVEDRFDIRDGQQSYGLIDIDYSDISQYSDFTIRIHADGYYGEAVERISRQNLTFVNMGGGVTKVLFTDVDDLNISSLYSRRWRGELFAQKTIPNYPASLTNSGVFVNIEHGHTGKRCLEVSNINGANFFQGRLTLQPNEKYQFSGWFSSPNNLFLLKNEESMFIDQMKLEFFDFNGNVVGNQVFSEADVLQGTFIEDWQKFTIDFTMPVGAHYVSVKLPNTHEVYDQDIQDYVQEAYYDDLRFQPLDGGMQTYVYNQENQRLEAQLDGNNYATFYYYDEQGNLFLVKRETENGIITVQESRNYLKRD